MDTNQVIERSEGTVKTAAEAIAKATFNGRVIGAAFGAGVLAGALLAKFVVAPFWEKTEAQWNSRPPKEIQVGAKKEPPAEEPKETETESDEETTEK